MNENSLLMAFSFANLMGNFDATIFIHAGYVAFVYALVAWGATYYRQLLDDLDVKEAVKMGEDMYLAYDPLGILLILVLCVFFLTFAALALYVFPLEIRYYVIPLAFAVNIVQLSYRYHRQRVVVKTLGIVGKSVFDSKFRVAPYRAIKRMEVQHDLLWNVLILHFYDTGSRGELAELHVRISKRSLHRIVSFAEANTGVTAKEKTQPKRHYDDPSATDSYL